MAQQNTTTLPVTSGELWAAYERLFDAEQQAWQHYRQLAGKARAAFVAWSQATQATAQAYDEYAHRAGSNPRPDTVTVSS